MNQQESPKAGFTPAEIRAFRLHAVLTAALAAAMYAVAPKGLGQVLGVIFAFALLPVPSLVIYVLRRRKSGR